MTKVIFVHASFGEGHKTAAQALHQDFDAACLDLLDFCHPRLRKLYSRGYKYITGHAALFWFVLFFLTRLRAVTGVIDIANRVVFRRFLRHIEAERPDVVVTTHFFVAGLVSFLKKRYGTKIVVIITDLRAHPYWAHRGVDRYFAAMDVTAQDLVALGVPRENILSGYVSLRPGFLGKLDRPALSASLFTQDRPCVLFMSSLRGVFPYFEAVLTDLLAEYNLIVIYGSNRRLKAKLDKISNEALRYFERSDQIWELIAASDMIVTKPGGLTVFEGVYLRKPFIVTHYIPGQEKGNMDILISQGICRYAAGPVELIGAIRFFAANRERIAANYPLKFKDIRPALREVIRGLSDSR